VIRRLGGPGFAWYRSLLLQLAAVALATVAGCTCRYSFSQSSIPSHINTVAIPPVRNETVEPALDQEVTDAITREFILDNSLRVLPIDEADSAILGVIIGYRNHVFGFNAQEQTEEYEVIIEMRIEFKDLVKRKTLWEEKRMIGRTTYFVVDTSGQEAQTEVEGRGDAIELLANDILSRTVRSWN
jgi:hypothetical protein